VSRARIVKAGVGTIGFVYRKVVATTGRADEFAFISFAAG
jgi:hypothetical protein